MKTTIELSDPILEQAKQLAAREGTTLRAVMEESLRRTLAEREHREPFHLRRATFRGHGLSEEARDGGWDRIRDLAYAGRGA